MGDLSPNVPEDAGRPTPQSNVPEERTGDVRATYMAVGVLSTQVEVGHCLGRQAVHGVRHELATHLQEVGERADSPELSLT